MKTLELKEMESLSAAGWWDPNKKLRPADIGCGLLGLAAGIASGFNPLVGGLTASGCILTLGAEGQLVLE